MRGGDHIAPFLPCPQIFEIRSSNFEIRNKFQNSKAKMFKTKASRPTCFENSVFGFR